MNTTVEQIAEVCHETNRAFCASIGDNSQLTWNNSPAWQRRSAINGVKFHLQNPTALPSASHENWLKEKKETGWKYGPVKNLEKLEHPCFVPYEALPLEQQVKDMLFIAVVNSMKRLLPTFLECCAAQQKAIEEQK